jgi:very-short-patch-repair endonuclease
LVGSNLIVEMDGVYWHSSDKQIEKDRQQEKDAIESGYKVIRFTDKEIKDTKRKCYERLREYI